MREQYRLGTLEMGVARHRRVERLGRALDQRPLHLGDPAVDAGDDLPEVQPLVERDLVVPGPSSVQLAADLADHFHEPALDVRVDVLELGTERERAVLELTADLGQTFQDLLQLRRRQDAGALERACPRLAAGDVLGPQAAVEGQRRRELLGGGIGRGAKAPPPRLHASSSAMSAITCRATSSRRLRSGARRVTEKLRGRPTRTRIGWRRGT